MAIARKARELSGLSGLRRAGSRLGDDEIVVRFAVGFELHLVFIECEFDAGVDRNQGLIGGLLLPNVVIGGGGADNIFLAEQRRALLVLIGLGATVHGRFGNNRAGLRLLAGLNKARRQQGRRGQQKGSFHGDSSKNRASAGWKQVYSNSRRVDAMRCTRAITFEAITFEVAGLEAGS